MASSTVQIMQRRGPGRPKTRDTEIVTLNLDREVLKHLKKMSAKYGIPMNHLIETLVLSSINNEYPLKVKGENERLKKKIKELESELEMWRKKCRNDNPNARRMMELKEKIHRFLDEYGELKVFELVKMVFNVPPGERLHHKIDDFINEYFVEANSKEFVSKDLELVITKQPRTGKAGWIVKKLQDTP